MSYPKHIWDQLKNLTADDFVRALDREKNGFLRDIQQGYSSGARIVWRHPDGRRVAIDYHPGKTYGRKQLIRLLNDIGWSEDELRDNGWIR